MRVYFYVKGIDSFITFGAVIAPLQGRRLERLG